MAIQSMQLDPNAASYTDDEIVGKINTASANITRAGCIEGTAASALDSDDIGEGSSNLYDTGAPPTTTDDLSEGSTNKYMVSNDGVVTAINSASNAITRERWYCPFGVWYIVIIRIINDICSLLNSV